MSKQFTIASAYNWSETGKPINNSEKAIKQISNTIKKRFSGKSYNYNINYKRLRASAGRTMLNSIIHRIRNAQVLIIDITTLNANVFIEAGIALAIQQEMGEQNILSIYFIREKSKDIKLPNGVPSDLQGYFISEYTLNNKGEVVFNDGGSLRMSIESDVKDYYNSINDKFDQIDEIEP